MMSLKKLCTQSVRLFVVTIIYKAAISTAIAPNIILQYYQVQPQEHLIYIGTGFDW